AARLGEAERALVGADHAGAVAVRAGTRDAAGRRARTVAGVAHPGRADLQRQGGTADRVGELQRHLGLDVATLGRAAPPGRRTAEDVAEQVGEPAAEPPLAGRAGTAGVAQQVRQVERHPAAPAGAAPERAGTEQRTHLVVLGALLLVGEHVVRPADLLEALLGVPVARVTVGGRL